MKQGKAFCSLFSFIAILIAINGIFASAYVETYSQESSYNPFVEDVTITDFESFGDNVTINEPVYLRKSIRKTNTSLDGGLLNSNDLFQQVRNSEYTAFEIDIDEGTVENVNPDYEFFNRSWEAINASPAWVRPALINSLRTFTPYWYDSIFSEVILSCDDDIIDEVAFQFAHLSEDALFNERFRTDVELLVENARLIYTLADSLNYVNLVEYDSDEGPYTTCEYKVVNGEDTTWVEIPKEIYYWYVVHPKLSDEGVYSTDNPASTTERTYDYFWREYLWFNPSSSEDYTDEGTYPQLNGMMLGGNILCGDEGSTWTRSGVGTDWAIGLAGLWVSHMMPNTPTGVRPVQPNHLAMIHRGNCGEGQDLLGAAARTALIPCMLVSNTAEDHVWNEVYVDGWRFFQVDNHGGPVHYDQAFGGYDTDHGGSKDISTVWGYRGDGYISQCTERYSDVATLIVNISDRLGNPVDGAYVVVVNESFYSPDDLAYSTVCWSDCNGRVEIPIGNNQNFYLHVSTDIGNWPEGTGMTVERVVSDAIAGEEYVENIVIPGTITNSFDPSSESDPDSTRYLAEIEFSATDVIVGTNLVFDGLQSTFHYVADSGKVNFFLCDESNFALYTAGEEFDAYYLNENINGGEVEFYLPGSGRWYAVIDNSYSMVNHQLVKASCSLYDLEGIEEKDIKPITSAIAAYPNPFNGAVTLDVTSGTSVEIVDLKGNRVWNSNNVTGDIIWQPDKDVASGIYVVKTINDNNSQSKRIVYMK